MRNVWPHLRAIAVLPGLALVGVPATILIATGAIDVGWGLPAALAWLPVLLGALLMGAGLALIYRTIRLFARAGQGTLAPWDPTRRLVIQGPYRYLRNPMISGVLAVLIGEAVLLGSLPVAAWCAVFLAANAVWFPLVEEPGLRRRFGREYDTYARAVPRWIPRRTPWSPPTP
jgi:protein-S-isoprenylcysteine O-methyltransferase Ste14